MQMDVQVGGRAESLDEGDRAGVGREEEKPNAVWTSDITYIHPDEGWLYLAAVIDLYARQVVGWSMTSHMETSLVADALRMAWFRRRPEKPAGRQWTR